MPGGEPTSHRGIVFRPPCLACLQLSDNVGSRAGRVGARALDIDTTVQRLIEDVLVV